MLWHLRPRINQANFKWMLGEIWLVNPDFTGDPMEIRPEDLSDPPGLGNHWIRLPGHRGERQKTLAVAWQGGLAGDSETPTVIFFFFFWCALVFNEPAMNNSYASAAHRQQPPANLKKKKNAHMRALTTCCPKKTTPSARMVMCRCFFSILKKNWKTLPGQGGDW